MLKRLLPVILALAIIPLLALADEARIVSVEATSWIRGKDPAAYAPARMIDGAETTAFQFSTQTTPLGQEYVIFRLDGPSAVRALWIKNGFWKITDGHDQYLRNSRVKRMTVDFLYGGESAFRDPLTVVLPDDSARADWTQVDLGSHSGVTAVRFLILDIYTGSKYPNDVCISEVRFTDGSAADLYGLAIDKLATRDGPGTQYNGKGTYSVKGQYIKVLSRAWDSRNSIWWVKCEIPYHGEIRVLWTGYMRFDAATLPLDRIPLEGGSAPTSVPVTAVPSPVTPVPSTPAPTLTAWQSAYRTFFTAGTYRAYQRCVTPEYAEMFAARNPQWDRIALFDMDANGTPELLVITEYGIEQADVFTWDGSAVRWLGVIGGDNFFQDLFYYPGTAYGGLFAALGGPAMDIRRATLQGGLFTCAHVADTVVNSDGDTTIGLRMDASDTALYTLLYRTFVIDQNPSVSLQWFLRSDLQTDAGWNSFFQSEIR